MKEREVWKLVFLTCSLSFVKQAAIYVLAPLDGVLAKRPKKIDAAKTTISPSSRRFLDKSDATIPGHIVFIITSGLVG